LGFHIFTAIVAAGRSIRANDAVAGDGWIEILMQNIPDSAISTRSSGESGDLFVGQGFAAGDFFDYGKNTESEIRRFNRL